MASNETNRSANGQTVTAAEGLPQSMPSLVKMSLSLDGMAFDGTDLDTNLLLSEERLDRASPDLWPEQSRAHTLQTLPSLLTLASNQFPE